MTILIGNTSKPGLLPTPPARYSIGFAGWYPNDVNKPFIATPMYPPPPPPELDALEARGVVCTERQVVSHGEKTYLIPTRVQVGEIYTVDCKMKNSFVEFALESSYPMARRLSCPGSLEVTEMNEAPPEQAHSAITTYMIRNIPTRFTSVTFVRLLEDYGFRNKFNFLYIPIDFRSGKNLGYAFINFMDPDDGLIFVQKFHSRRLPVSTSKKILEILPSRRQGFAENIALFRTSDLLSSVSLPHYKPLIATAETNGQLVPLSDANFPPP